MAEAGGIIAGGHTVIDAEPKYGLSVMGTVHPRQLLSKSGAQPGDVLVLTKALGTGLILTAAKRDLVDPIHLQVAVDSMLTLNRHASHLAREAGAHALTDVTGFGITGHALEIASHSAAELILRASNLPLLPGAAGGDSHSLSDLRGYATSALEDSQGRDFRTIVFPHDLLRFH